jgi:acyl-CoA thioesterase FadM
LLEDEAFRFMSLFVRFIAILIAGLFRPSLKPLDESWLTLRVWPNDIDINGHMNNGRYLTIMDLGRLDLISRTALGKVVLRRRWQPLVASAMIRYYRSLKPFQKYSLKTKVAGWDEKWLFIEQHFERRGTLIATGLVKVLFRDRHGNVPTAAVLSAVNVNLSSPELPPAVTAWQEAEKLLEKPNHETPLKKLTPEKP